MCPLANRQEVAARADAVLVSAQTLVGLRHRELRHNRRGATRRLVLIVMTCDPCGVSVFHHPQRSNPAARQRLSVEQGCCEVIGLREGNRPSRLLVGHNQHHRRRNAARIQWRPGEGHGRSVAVQRLSTGGDD